MSSTITPIDLNNESINISSEQVSCRLVNDFSLPYLDTASEIFEELGTGYYKPVSYIPKNSIIRVEECLKALISTVLDMTYREHLDREEYQLILNRAYEKLISKQQSQGYWALLGLATGAGQLAGAGLTIVTLDLNPATDLIGNTNRVISEKIGAIPTGVGQLGGGIQQVVYHVQNSGITKAQQWTEEGRREIDQHSMRTNQINRISDQVVDLSKQIMDELASHHRLPQ
ncbi:MAG: hypothetical protein WDZ28_05405 [Simkaniaceae bacterium]